MSTVTRETGETRVKVVLRLTDTPDAATAIATTVNSALATKMRLVSDEKSVIGGRGRS